MKKILMVGDSHAGITFPLLQTFLEQEGYYVDYIFNNGWATYSYTSKPSALLSKLENDPDIVIVSLGGNNHRLNDERYQNHVNEFLELIGYPGRKILWISPKHAERTDVQDRHIWTHNFLSQRLPDDIDYYDVFYSMYPMASDGVHYPVSSYEMFVSELVPQIKTSLSDKEKEKSPIPLLIGALALIGFVALS